MPGGGKEDAVFEYTSRRTSGPTVRYECRISASGECVLLNTDAYYLLDFVLNIHLYSYVGLRRRTEQYTPQQILLHHSLVRGKSAHHDQSESFSLYFYLPSFAIHCLHTIPYHVYL